MNKLGFVAALAATTMIPLPAFADKIDDIVAAGTLRCAVSLDLPPIGFRDAKNEPVGFDVDYCRDLAAALGVELSLIEATIPERIPIVVSGRADVAIANTSDTLERAKTIGFSIPYFAFHHVIMTRKDTGITKYEDLAGRAVGAVAGAYDSQALEADVKKWNNTNGSFRSYQSTADSLLALTQGQIDAMPIVNTMAAELLKSGKYTDLIIAGSAPYDVDYVAIIANKGEQELLNYLDLFINRQVRSGRFAELYKKWLGEDAEPVSLDTNGVYR